jgi:hypothetical protein
MQHPESLCGGARCCAARLWVERGEAHNPAHRTRPMQDAEYELRRIALPKLFGNSHRRTNLLTIKRIMAA